MVLQSRVKFEFKDSIYVLTYGRIDIRWEFLPILQDFLSGLLPKKGKKPNGECRFTGKLFGNFVIHWIWGVGMTKSSKPSRCWCNKYLFFFYSKNRSFFYLLFTNE